MTQSIGSGKKDALDVLQLIDLRNAVESRQERAVIQGEEFRIKYEKDNFFYQNVEKLVPAGRMSYTKLQERTNFED